MIELNFAIRVCFVADTRRTVVIEKQPFNAYLTTTITSKKTKTDIRGFNLLPIVVKTMCNFRIEN